MKNVKASLFFSGLVVVLVSAFDVWSAITPYDETTYVTQQRSMSDFEQNQNGNTGTGGMTCPTGTYDYCNYAEDIDFKQISEECCRNGAVTTGYRCDTSHYAYRYTKDELVENGLMDNDGKNLSAKCCHSYNKDTHGNVGSETWYCSTPKYPQCSSAIADSNYRNLLDISHPSSCEPFFCAISEGNHSGKCVNSNGSIVGYCVWDPDNQGTLYDCGTGDIAASKDYLNGRNNVGQCWYNSYGIKYVAYKSFDPGIICDKWLDDHNKEINQGFLYFAGFGEGKETDHYCADSNSGYLKTLIKKKCIRHYPQPYCEGEENLNGVASNAGPDGYPCYGDIRGLRFCSCDSDTYKKRDDWQEITGHQYAIKDGVEPAPCLADCDPEELNKTEDQRDKSCYKYKIEDLLPEGVGSCDIKTEYTIGTDVFVKINSGWYKFYGTNIKEKCQSDEGVYECVDSKSKNLNCYHKTKCDASYFLFEEAKKEDKCHCDGEEYARDCFVDSGSNGEVCFLVPGHTNSKVYNTCKETPTCDDVIKYNNEFGKEDGTHDGFYSFVDSSKDIGETDVTYNNNKKGSKVRCINSNDKADRVYRYCDYDFASNIRRFYKCDNGPLDDATKECIYPDGDLDNNVPITPIYVYAACDCTGYLPEDELCSYFDDPRYCKDHILRSDKCSSTDEEVLYREVVCPVGFYSQKQITEFKNSDNYSWWNDTTALTDRFIGDRIGVNEAENYDDWAKFYTVNVADNSSNICIAGEVVKNDKYDPTGTGDAQKEYIASTTIKSKELILSCENIMSELQQKGFNAVFEDDNKIVEDDAENGEDTENTEDVDDEGNDVEDKPENNIPQVLDTCMNLTPCLTKDNKLKNICSCAEYYGEAAEQPTEDDVTEGDVCIFAGEKFYAYGGPCPTKLTGYFAIVNSNISETDLRNTYGRGIEIGVCSKGGEPKQIVTCNGEMYNVDVEEYPFVLKEGVDVLDGCRIANEGSEINKDSKMFYRGNQCKIVYSKCGKEINRKSIGANIKYEIVEEENDCYKLGTGIGVEECQTDDGLNMWTCYYDGNKFKYNTRNCSISHDLSRPYIWIGGVKHWDKCDCATPYKWHFANCEVTDLYGSTCVQAEVDDGFISDRAELKMYKGLQNLRLYTGCRNPKSGLETPKEECKNPDDGTWAKCYYCCPAGMKATGAVSKNSCGSKVYKCI